MARRCLGAPLVWLSLLACSCSLSPRYQRPPAPIPKQWPQGEAYGAASSAPLPSVRYQDVFRDPNLQAVIGVALHNSRDLRVAAANVLSAHALYRVQRAGYFPRIDAGVGATFGRG